MSILGRDTCQSAAICIYAVRAVAVAKRREYSRNPTKLMAIEAIECPKCTCSNPGFALLVDLFFAISQALQDVLQATWRAP